MKNTIFFLIFFFNTNAWAQEVPTTQATEDIIMEPGRTQEMQRQQPQQIQKRQQTQPMQKQHTQPMQRSQINAHRVEGFKKYAFTANLGANFTRIRQAGNDPGLMFGGKYSFYLSPNTGLFIGLDYVQRNVITTTKEHNTFKLKMRSIDIPFGLTFKYGKFTNANGAVFLGLYYSLPQNGETELEKTSTRHEWREERNFFGELDGENYMGLLLHSETYFKVNESLDFGFFFTLKFGFGNSMTTTVTRRSRIYSDRTITHFEENANAMDTTFGVAVRF